MSDLFLFTSPIRAVESVIPHLAEGERHWKKGRSAYELATSWVSAGGFPPTVARVLDTKPALKNLHLVEGFFEKSTPLGTPGRDSQTDLLLFCRSQDGDVVIGVEGKVDEPFGPVVGDWLGDSPTRRRRLEDLLQRSAIPEPAASALRYQLFHRTVAALIEAERARISGDSILISPLWPLTGTGGWRCSRLPALLRARLRRAGRGIGRR